MNKVSKQFYILKMLFLALLVSMLLIESLSAKTRYRVKSSDNLNSIIERFYKDSELSKAQLMAGILATNPSAFKKGNINFLLRGKRLNLPAESDIQQISPETARELLASPARVVNSKRSDTLNSNNSKELLARQKLQTKKINLLQKESDALKKQLEALVNVKADSDQRLLELEKSLKETLNSANSKDSFSDNAQANKQAKTAKTSVLKKANKHLQQSLQETKSELAENANVNITLERKVENLKDAKKPLLDTIKDNKVEGSVRTEKESLIEQPFIESIVSNLQSKLIWLVPLFLLLLAGLLYLLLKKKKAKNRDSAYRASHYQETFLEPSENIDTDFEEDSLETSIKIDVARAYIEAEDTQSALEILTEIMEEGSDEQRQQARELLGMIS